MEGRFNILASDAGHPVETKSASSLTFKQQDTYAHTDSTQVAQRSEDSGHGVGGSMALDVERESSQMLKAGFTDALKMY